jgi:hypothetical protein
MNKTIESVWKEGFLDDNALVAPRVNDLYNRRSEQTIDRFIRMLRWNFYGIAATVVAVFLVSIFVGAPVAGTIFAVALGLFAAHARTQVLKFESIDRTADSYRYVTAFNDLISAFLKRNAQVFRLSVPVMLLSFNEIVLPSDANIASRTPMFVVAIVVFVFAGPISRFDVNLFYRNAISRLREIQSEMEQLRGTAT